MMENKSFILIAKLVETTWLMFGFMAAMRNYFDVSRPTTWAPHIVEVLFALVFFG